MTPSQVAENLLERDLVMLMMYARKHMLPTRRLQMQLARLCQITAGDSNRTLGEFLFDPPAEPIHDDDSSPGLAQDAAQVLGMMGGAGVYVLGRKRREREAALALERSQ